MSTNTIIPEEGPSLENMPVSSLDRLARNIFFGLLDNLERGELILREGQQTLTFGHWSEAFPLRAAITIQHPRCYRDIVFDSSIGAGRAYMQGLWSSDDLTMVIRIFLLNHRALREIDRGWKRLTEPFYRGWHWLRRNTKAGSQENIISHYDLGNEFYAIFLDPTMTYSCGIFESPEYSMQAASVAKYERICRKLALEPEDHVLEIGTGWGGFALYAAQQYGCRLTTITISHEQYDFARQRIAEAGLADRVSVLLKDYRDLEGQYDKLVSIEMIEAVGHQFYDTFFRTCGDRLKETGMMLIQAITIADYAFEQHTRSVDFIKRYIFPGSCIPSLTALSESMAKVTNLRLVHLEDLTPHYATTLRLWRERFMEKHDEIRDLGFSETFIRMWEFYFCYCEAGFAERYLGDVQVLFTKPLCRRPPLLPPLG